MKSISMEFSSIETKDGEVKLATLRIDSKCVIPQKDSLPIDLTGDEKKICEDLIDLGVRHTAPKQSGLTDDQIRAGTCRLNLPVSGNVVGTKLVYSHRITSYSDGTRYAFHPEGEPDMQSMMVLRANEFEVCP